MEYHQCAFLQQHYLQVRFLALYILVSSLPLPRFLLLTTALFHFFILEDKSFGHSLLLNYVSPVSCSLFHTFYSFLILCLLVVVLISPPLLHSSSAKYNFFVSFSINLKEEIYFCRNFPSKAFESPSLVVTPPPPRALPLPASRFLQVPRRATLSSPFLHDAPFPLYLESL
jgi:hypothetical protein